MSIYVGNKKIAGLIRGEDISHATEIHAGIIEIATQEEVNSGTDDLKAITPKKLNEKLKNYDYKKEIAELQEDVKELNSNQIKGYKEGERIDMDDGAEMRCELGVEGHSTQETRSGKNLFDEQYTNIGSGLIYKPLKVGIGSFTLSTTTPINNGSACLFLLAGNVTTGASYLNNVYAENSKTVLSENEYVTIAYRTVGTINPKDYKTQLEEGSTATPYEPYGASPSPEFPSEIKSVDGWNIWDEEWEKGYYNSEGIYNVADNQICTKNHIKVKPNKKYWLGIPLIVTENLGICLYDKNKNFIERISLNNFQIKGDFYTTDNETFYIKINFSSKYGNNYNNDIVISEGTTPKPYQPYGHYISEVIQNKNFADLNNVTVSNRFDISDGNTMINNISDSRTDFRLRVLGYNSEKTRITQFGDKTFTDIQKYCYNFTTNENTYFIGLKHNGSSRDIGSNAIAEVKPNTKYTLYINVKGYNSSIIGGIILENVMIVEGTYTIETIGEYQPHQTQPISIPVQKPMRSNKDGTVRDDFVNIDGNWFERHKIREKVFDGSDDENWYISGYLSNNQYIIKTDDVSGDRYDIGNIMCNILPNSVDTSTAYEKNNIYNIGTWDEKQLRVNIPIEIANRNVLEFKAWLSLRPAIVNYILEEPELLPCTPEQIEAITQRIKTYKNITHIYSNDETPAYIKVKYNKDLETIINNLETRIETIESEG